MLLPLLLIFLILIEFQFRFSILNHIQFLSLFFHQKCLQIVPESPFSQEALAALVCGKNFENLSTAQLYSSTGLIHLFVVSGSHLLLLQKIFSLKKEFHRLSPFLLLFYGAVCLFNPPIMRSLVFIFFTYLLTTHHRHWPKHYVLFTTGLLTLALKPEWLSSLSLQMSWIAAIALHIYSEKLDHTSIVVRQILFYLLFIFCFQGLGFPELSIIILCVIMTPVLEYILFPLALLTVVFHMFEPLFSVLITSLNILLKNLEFYSTPSLLAKEFIVFLNWTLIFCGHFLLFSKAPKS